MEPVDDNVKIQPGKEKDADEINQKNSKSQAFDDRTSVN
jgi:hypothetical protein